MGSAVNLICKNGSVAQESLGNPGLGYKLEAQNSDLKKPKTSKISEMCRKSQIPLDNDMKKKLPSKPASAVWWLLCWIEVRPTTYRVEGLMLP